MFVRKLLVTSIAAAMLTACGSGGGGGGDSGSGSTATSSLTMPDQIDVVSAKTSTAAALMRSASRAFNDAGTDYENAEQHVHVWHPALKPAETVNTVLCFIGQLKGENFANAEGTTYLALVDNVGCDKGGESDSQSQSSGASNEVSYVHATVTAKRATESSPLEVKAWIPDMNMGGGTAALMLHIEVTSGPTEAKPYGDFHMSFAFFPSMDEAVTNGTVNESAAMGKGELFTVKSGNDVGFNFIMEQSAASMFGDMGEQAPDIPGNVANSARFTEKAAVLTSADGATGSAVTQQTITGLPENFKEQLKDFAHEMFKAYGLAYNSSNVLIGKSDDLSGVASTSQTQCLSRDNFYESVWRYGLYDANTGAEVELNSGIPFRYSSNNDGKMDAFGYVGYWGLWTEDHDANLDGKTVTKQSFGGNGETAVEEYTLHVKPGRLVKKTVQTLSVNELGDTQFDFNDNMGGNYRVKFKFGGTGAAGFYKTASVSWNGDNGPSESPTACTDTANASACSESRVSPFEGQREVFLYSQQLGGGVRWKQGATKIIFYKEEFVSELNADLNLVCYNQCPRSDISTEMSWDTAYSQAVDWSSFPASVTPIEYSFPKSGANAFILMRDDARVVLSGNASDWQSSPFSFGLRSGMLIEQSKAVAAGLPTTSGTIDGATMNKIYDGTSIDEFYEWQTGFDSYNKQVVVTDSHGDEVVFDKPLNFNYVHSDANDRSVTNGVLDHSPYDGMHFLLQYQGAGQMQGIPFEKMEGSDEGEEGKGRYYPIFTLNDATQLTDDSGSYVLKALDMEQFMVEDAGACTGMSLSSVPDAPSAISSDYDIQIGAMPTVSDDTPPSVVGGEIQAQ